MSLKPEDIPELTRLIELCTSPSVSAYLRQALASIPKPITDPVPPPSAPSADAPPTGAAVPAAPAPSKDITYIQPRYCFEQDNDNVTVLILDLPPFTPETKAGVVCNIQSDSLDITIPPNRRLRLFPLEKPVNAPQSTFKVKKTQVEITLKKASKWEHWGDLVAKKSAAEKKKVDADPSAGLMDLMKDLYNDGNDATKKIIAEAMQQSGKDRGKGGGMGDFGGGMGGGMGGGGMGGGAFGSGGDFGDSLDDDEAAL